MTDNTQEKGIYVRQTYGYIYSGDLVSKAEEAVDTVTRLSDQVSDKTQTVITKAGEVETNKTAAQNACTKAFAWATQLDTPVEDGEYSAKYWALQAASIQSDWAESDATKSSYIQNKPTLISNLSDLTDVTVTSVMDGESLVYDSVNTVWQGGGIKANSSLDNLTATGKSTGAGLAMPSSTYENLTLGSSGDTYTAPANGYYWLRKSTGTSEYIIIETPSGLSSRGARPASSSDLDIYVPVKKADVITVSYTATGTTKYFRFIYAEGEV